MSRPKNPQNIEPTVQSWDNNARAQARSLANEIFDLTNMEASLHLVPLLSYLIDHSGSANTELLEEKNIGARVFRLPTGWQDKKPKSTEVKVYIAKLRKELDRYFSYTVAGRDSQWRLEIPNRKDTTFYEIKLVANRRVLQPDVQFWDAYTAEDSSPLVVYTQPLFFWDKESREYRRFLDINYEGQLVDTKHIKEAIVQRYGIEDRIATLEPCFHYVSLGESRTIKCLQIWFRTHWVQGEQVPLQARSKARSRAIPLEVRSSRELTEEEVFNRNIIVLGNARTNRYIRYFQQGMSFQLGDHVIKISDPDLADGKTELPDERDGKQGCAYAVMTRCRGKNPKKTVTLVAANNGVAGWKVMEYLTSEGCQKALLQAMKSDNSDNREGFSKSFQILFEVDTAGGRQAFDARPKYFSKNPRPPLE